MLERLVIVISKHPEEYTGAKFVELPESGGSIGRNPGCSVPLVDHNRYISSTHCLVSIYGDAYYISDVSTNGLIVNGNKLLKGYDCFRSVRVVSQCRAYDQYDGHRV